MDVDEIACVGQSFLQSLGLKRAKDAERKPPRNICDWNIGDVFAVKMDTPCASAAYLDDTTLLLRVIRFSGPLDGLRYPFVYRMIWLDAELPQSTKDINLAGYLRSKANNPWEEPLPPEHRVLLLSKTPEEFAKEVQSFMFVGNHKDALDPENDPMFDNGGLATWISDLRQDACFAFHNFGIDYL